MSFNINGPDNKPVIREAQTMQNDGGGGNLGYMQGGGKNEEQKQEETFLLEKDGPSDAFIKNTDEKEVSKEVRESFINKIITFFKKIFQPNISPKKEEKDFLTLSTKK